MPFLPRFFICRASCLLSAGRIIPFDKSFTWVCTAKSTGLGSTLETNAISFKPKVLSDPNPAIEASFAAFLKIRTESLAEEIRMTSSVNETVTEIAFGSLNNRVNLFLLALS